VTATPPSPLRIGVGLGGGSARGYAHIGALAALERHGFPPTVVVGASFGAVIGAFYASGQTPEQMALEASKMRRRDVIPHVTDFGLHRAALFSGAKLEAYFERITEGRHFSDLVKPLIVLATDIDTGEAVQLQEGSVARALRASASMPGIFAPVELAGRRLVDGGLGAPVPLATLAGLDLDLAIGIGAGTTGEDSAAIQVAQRLLASPLGRRLHRSLRESVRTHAFSRLGRGLAYTADTYLPRTHDDACLQVHTNPPINWLQFHRAEHAIGAGERALEAFRPRIRQALQGLPVALG
jgi:NTE family protein